VEVGQAFLADGNVRPTTSVLQEQSVNELFDGCWNGQLSSYGNVMTVGRDVKTLFKG
jgi:hypothetical protein